MTITYFPAPSIAGPTGPTGPTGSGPTGPTGPTGPVAGSNGQVLYNSSGVVTGSANLTFDGTNLSVGTITSAVTNLNVTSSANALFGATTTGSTNVAVYTAKGSGDPVIQMAQFSPSSAGTTFGLSNNSLAVLQTTTTVSNHPSALAIGNFGNIPLVFGNNSAEQMRIHTNGNVGIGYTAPASKLAVNGAIFSSSSVTINTAAGNDFISTDGTTTVRMGIGTYFGTGLAAIGTDQNTPLLFATYSAERMRIDGAGNVGINITPANWSGLALNNSGALQGQYWALVGVGTDQTNFAQNAVGNGSGGWKYQANGYSTQYIQSQGAHVWQTAASGTANANISYSNVMLLNANGLLGVNSAPDSVSRLTVAENSDGYRVGFFINRQPPTYAAIINSFTVAAASATDYSIVGGYGNGSVITTNSFIVRTNGDVQNSNNSYGAISDLKLKDNIVDVTPKLADLMSVKVRHFNYKENPNLKQIGVIAQELESVFPGMVQDMPDRDMDGKDLGTVTKTVKYSVFVPMLIKAMQEQQAVIEDMRGRITKLESTP